MLSPQHGSPVNARHEDRSLGSGTRVSGVMDLLAFHPAQVHSVGIRAIFDDAGKLMSTSWSSDSYVGRDIR